MTYPLPYMPTEQAHLDDAQLLLRFADPEQRNYAFSLIMRKYQERLYWHIRKMVIDHEDANDLTQDAFVKAWKGLENFKQESNLYTWLYRIATNECLTFLDKKRKRFFLPIHDVERELADKITSGQYISGDELQLRFQKALLTLPQKQRLVFNMRYYDELSYEQISEIVGTSVGALKASYHIAAKKIEALISDAQL